MSLVLKKFRKRAVAAPLPAPGPQPELQAQPQAQPRGRFFELLGAGVEVAEPGSAPALILVEIAAPAPGDDASQDAAALVAGVTEGLCGVVGDSGIICHLGELRFGVMVATDGPESPDAVGTRILATIATLTGPQSPHRVGDAVLGVALWGPQGETAEELFVAADAEIHRMQESQQPSGGGAFAERDASTKAA